VYGGDGDDALIGDNENSIVNGADGLYGQDGNDTLIGNDAVYDAMYGGPGSDTCWADYSDYVASDCETVYRS
jgi:hypothetical protein